MPFRSKKQQRFMFSQMPDTAKEWAKKTDFSKLPEKARKKRKKKDKNDLKLMASIYENEITRKFAKQDIINYINNGISKLAIRFNQLPTIWYENEDGKNEWIPDLKENEFNPPEGFRYQHSKFPSVLRETVLKLMNREDIESCKHPETRTDHGLIDGFEGRICNYCGGYQNKQTGEPWPEQWEVPDSQEVCSMESSYPPELILAMTRPTKEEQRKSKKRGYSPKVLSFDQAVLMAATACERCLNALLWMYGCNDGYPEKSQKWKNSNTKCKLCERKRRLGK
jgi:hypothetical protein